jgi:hypothetical protein
MKKIYLNGKLFTYSSIGGNFRTKISFLLLKPTEIIDDKATIYPKLLDKNKIFWAYSGEWWKIIGDFEIKFYENVHNMPNFMEITITNDKRNPIIRIDKNDMRDFKIDYILDEIQEMPFV